MVRYSNEKPLRVFTAFSGYDSQCLALERLKEMRDGFDYELVGWSEIEPNAIKAHNLLFPQWADRNFGDISKIDWSKVADFDFSPTRALAPISVRPGYSVVVRRVQAHAARSCGSAGDPLSQNARRTVCWRM